MFIDALSVPTGTVIETEVCIVGAGAAGISLAREFTNSSFRVVLLESGGTELETATQDLARFSPEGSVREKMKPVSRDRSVVAPTHTRPKAYRRSDRRAFGKPRSQSSPIPQID
jgi:choline dehydrogenase-like flavoprotein